MASWLFILPLFAGATAIYLLLPRPRAFPALCGALLGVVALGLAGFFVVGFNALTPESFLFYVFSACAIGFGAMLVTQRNPARAALSFALVVLSSCGLFLLLAAPFLMAATIIIYAGAIIVTFLFVLMLAQQEGPSDADARSREPLLATVVGFVLLGALLLNSAIPHVFRVTDRHRLHQLQVIARITLQVLALLAIMLIVFGPPTQLSTVIGLITAGFTVVMKDFIVAFFGWFALMGKDGIRVGDWVEIEGVSGEVIEIGVLKTVLLELGNWTATGLPTGRRVAFSNSFAMEGHYFNFSTSNQWLWDELQFTLPAAGDPYQTADQIRAIVERETQADAAEAAKDWERVTHQYGTREFSAAPAVNLRPGSGGLELMVRYITRAPQREAVKAKLFQAVVDLLHKPA